VARAGSPGHTVRVLSTARRTVFLAAALDAAAVVVFVAVGRRNHDEGSALGGIVETAAPFLIGLAVAWLTTRAWKRPASLLTGLAVWPITVLVGMVVRRTVFDEGTATSFVIVATLFLGACFLGWRVARSATLTRRRLSAAR
jgi:hypothetical protein